MIQGLRRVLLLLPLLAGFALPAQPTGQVDPHPEHEDLVRRAVRKYQTKVDQLERLTRKVLADRNQQLADAETRLRQHQDEAAAVQRELATRNAQLTAQVARLQDQLAAAEAERHRLQRSLEERQTTPGTTTGTSTGATTGATTGTSTGTRNRVPAAEAGVGARLRHLEAQAARMEQWVRQLRRDVGALLTRPRNRDRGVEHGDEHQEAQERVLLRQPADIHIHNHAGSVVLHFHGGERPQVHHHHHDDGDHDDDDDDDDDEDDDRRDMVGRLSKERAGVRKGR